VLILQAEWASIGVHVKLQAEDESTETALYMKGQYDMTFRTPSSRVT